MCWDPVVPKIMTQWFFAYLVYLSNMGLAALSLPGPSCLVLYVQASEKEQASWQEASVFCRIPASTFPSCLQLFSFIIYKTKGIILKSFLFTELNVLVFYAYLFKEGTLYFSSDHTFKKDLSFHVFTL